MKRFIFMTYLVVGFGQSVLAVDFSDQKISQTNSNPFVRIHGLPGYSGSRVVQPGRFSTQILFEITNEFHQDTNSFEQVFLDYERSQLTLNIEYGITSGLSTGFILPFISNAGGFMDGWIENWHDLFGLPQGGREIAPRDEFLISYQNAEQSLFLDKSDQGIGDIFLFLDKQLIHTDVEELKARASLKLPTGDEVQLFGSGGYSFSVSLNGAKNIADHWQAYIALGLSNLQASGVLSNLQANMVGTAMLGIAWQINPGFGLSAQLDFNTKVYDESDLDAINGQAGVLNISANYQLSDKAELLFGFSEDAINKAAAADFGINLALKYLY